VFLAPLAASSDPLRESLCSVSVGNRYVNSVWTPLTLDPPRTPGDADAGSIASIRGRADLELMTIPQQDT
jgi:hypothetical protein